LTADGNSAAVTWLVPVVASAASVSFVSERPDSPLLLLLPLLLLPWLRLWPESVSLLAAAVAWWLRLRLGTAVAVAVAASSTSTIVLNGL